MRGFRLAMILVAAASLACGLFEDATERLDSSEAEAVCAASCDRQRECDDEFDAQACRGKCDASVAAWYLCPDAPDIVDYVEMCNAMACEEVSSCLEGRPSC